MNIIERSQSHRTEKKYSLIQKDVEFIKNIFDLDRPVCFTRAGAGESKLISNNNSVLGVNYDFKIKLVRSCDQTDVLGLQLDYRLQSDEKYYLKIIKACEKFDINIDFDKVVSARIFLLATELLPSLINNKTVLWINFEAHKFPVLLEDEKYRNYYMLENITSISIDIPDGMVVPYDVNIVETQNIIIQRLIDLEQHFDVAVIGAGPMANYLCIFIRDILNKSAIDVGCLLSAMRGQRNRRGFKKGENFEYLVWI